MSAASVQHAASAIVGRCMPPVRCVLTSPQCGGTSLAGCPLPGLSQKLCLLTGCDATRAVHAAHDDGDCAVKAGANPAVLLALTTEQMATRAASWLCGVPRSALSTSRVGGGRCGPVGRQLLSTQRLKCSRGSDLCLSQATQAKRLPGHMLLHG